MQSILPDNFPLSDLPPTERYKLEAFYDRFVIKRYREYGMGHLWLACYAALPAVMTPDLLYKLWLNFSSYHDGKEMRIHHVAVADLMLSPLFQEISFETYEMPVELKNALLKYWQSELKAGNYNRLATLESVAKFLLGYTKVFRTNDAKSDDAFRQAQAVTAWSYLDTQRASAMLLQSLEKASQKAKEEPTNRLARAEQLRLLDVARRTDQRHDLGLMAEGQSKPDNIKALAGYSQQLQSLLAGKDEDVLRILQQSGSDLQLTDEPGPGISIKAPTTLVKKTQPEEEEKEKGKLFLFMAGIDDYADTSLQLQGCKNDVDNLLAAVGQLGYEAQQTIVLKDEQATKAVFEKSLLEVFGNSGQHDQVLLFFAGHTTRIEGECNLVLFDSGQEGGYRGITLREIFAHYNRTMGEHSYLTILLDTELESLETPNPKVAVVTGGGMEAEGGSRFMNTLLPIWTRSKGRLSLQKLIAAVRNQTRANPNNAPEQTAQSAYSNSYGSYNEPGIAATTRSDGTDRLPDLFAFPEMAHQPLVRTSSMVRQMQSLLRSIGFYQGSSNGVYNQETDTALRAFLAEKRITGTPSPDSILQQLEEEKRWRESTYPKILLFVFSNPDNRLPSMNEEKERILSMADDIEKQTGAELVFLDNPSRQELRSYFNDASYRNQLLLFHFSGFEADPDGDGKGRGMFLQNGEEKDTIDYGELHHWLDFQENIRLFYLNTCYSAELAKILTIRGVQAAIGAPGLVYDNYAAEFAYLLYENMLKGMTLKEAYDKNSFEPFGEGQHRSIAPDQGEEMQGFQLFFDWGRREAAANWRWEIEQEQKQTKEEKPKKTATALYLETLKQLLEEDYMEMVLDRLAKFDTILNLHLETDITMNRSRFTQTERSLARGLVNVEASQREKQQIRFSLLSKIDEIPRMMALQKAAGDARWIDFTLPSEEDMVKFETKPELLDWLEKGLEAVKGIGRVYFKNQFIALGFLLNESVFLCGAISPSIRESPLQAANVELFSSFQYLTALGTYFDNQQLNYSYLNIVEKSIYDEKPSDAEKISSHKINTNPSIPEIGQTVHFFKISKNENEILELQSANITLLSEDNVFFNNEINNSDNNGMPIFNGEWEVVAICGEINSSVDFPETIKKSGQVETVKRGILIAPILQDIERQKGNDSSTYAA
ncbi:MAG: caspase family protein [Saprospiraceae bacterium]